MYNYDGIIKVSNLVLVKITFYCDMYIYFKCIPFKVLT